MKPGPREEERAAPGRGSFLEQVPDQRLDEPFRLEQVEALLGRGATSGR